MIQSTVNVPCKGLFGKLFGHNFQERYHEKSKTFEITVPVITPETIRAISEAAFIDDVPSCISDIVNQNSPSESEKTYVYDICISCGTIVYK